MQSTKPQGEYFTYIDIDAVNNKENIIDKPKRILCTQAPSRATRKLEENSILFSMVRPYLKNIALVCHEYQNAIASTGFYVIRPSINLLPKYIFRLLLSSYVVDGLNQYMKGDNSPSINNEHIENYLYPIPPINEQYRIVEKLEILFPIIAKYERSQIELEKLNVAIFERFKNSILQEAIQGKLVPQIAEEGSAQELVEQIKREKLRLGGKLKKKDLVESTIFKGDDNKYYERIGKEVVEVDPPFEIPASWSWVRLPQIGISELGKTLDKGKDVGELTPYLCSINVYWEGIRLNPLKKAPFTQSERSKYKLQMGDLLICEGGDAGRCAIWNSDADMWFQNALHRVQLYNGINAIYLKFVIEYYKSIGVIDKICKGMTIKHFTQNSLHSLLIPLPPITEQQRIVNMLDTTFDKIKR